MTELQSKANKIMQRASKLTREAQLLLVDGNIVECQTLVGIVARLVEEAERLLSAKPKKEDS